jgi:hypothetical protein
VAALGEDRGGDQRRLAGQRNTGGLHRDQHEEQDEAVREQKIGHAAQCRCGRIR